METPLLSLHQYIQTLEDKRIVLLREKEVLQWLFGDMSFLPPIEKKNKTADTKKYKALEDEWGRRITKIRRPDLQKSKELLDYEPKTTLEKGLCKTIDYFIEYHKW